jgi:hypothetical protein
LNKTNISLFYKYNRLYNSKKSDEEWIIENYTNLIKYFDTIF